MHGARLLWSPRILFLAVVVTTGVLISGAAEAETPTEVYEGATNGLYLPDEARFDSVALATSVERARSAGVSLLIIAPIDPEPDPRSFALRVRQAANVDAVLLFGANGEVEASVASDKDDHFSRALSAAKEASTPEAAANDFVEVLTSTADGSVPSALVTLFWWVVALVVVLFAVVAIEVSMSGPKAPNPNAKPKESRA